ncbi:MAG: S-layer homology domain-containing protein [Clostridia bacterium]|nr:S-layer homology domain-containing protein [Clostridia bacterium]
MKKYRQYIAGFLAVLLLTALLTGGVSGASDQLIVLKTSTEAEASVDKLTADTAVVHNYSYSAKWEKTTTDNKLIQFFSIANADITPYGYFNFWVHSEKATNSTINIAVFSNSRNENNKKGHILKKINVDWTGWKLFSIPIDTFSKSYTPDLTSIERIDFDARSWEITDTAANEETVLRFEEIWFSVNQAGDEDTSEPEEEPEITEPGLIAAFSSEKAVEKDLYKVLTADNTITKNYEWSGKWQSTNTKSIVSFDVSGINFNDYTNFEAWIYSEKATGSTINVAAFSKSRNENNRQGFILKAFNVDWTGWRLVSIPLTDFTQRYSPDLSDMEKIDFDARKWNASDVDASSETVLYFDSVRLNNNIAEPLEMISSYPENLAEDVPQKEVVIKLGFNNVIAEDSLLFDITGGETAPVFDVKADGKEITITVENLDYNTVYTVSGHGIRDIYGFATDTSLTFKTIEKELHTAVPSKNEDGKIDIVAANPENTDKTVIINVVTSKADGSVLFTQTEKTLQAKKSDEYVIDYTLGDAELARVYVTDENGKLLHNGYLEISQDGAKQIFPTDVTGENETEITITHAMLEKEKVTVEGNLKGKIPVTINLCIKNDTGIVFSDVLISDKEEIEIQLPINIISEGNYTLSLEPRKGKGASKTVQYLSETAMEEIKNAINSKLPSETEVLIEQNKNALWISGELGYKVIAEVLYEQKPYADYTKIAETAANAEKLFKKINSCMSTELSDLLVANKNIILFGSPYADDYEKLSEEDKNKKNIILTGKTYTSFSEFRANFNSVMQPILIIPLPGGSSGGGGGGGSSSGGKASYVNVDNSLLAGNTVNSVEIFNDIEEVSWAKEAIISIYNDGIISKPSDGKFRPADEITRAEFVKMFVMLLKLPLDKECNFNDVNKNDWSYPYIAAAYENKILFGKTDGSFGKDDFITRQDMAVMLYRALNMKNSTGDKFLDDSEISDYAKDAVYTMRSKGIINGIGDGKFAPKNNATRAEAAKIIFAAKEAE